ncbi:MAG TPA: hypothetical protein ENJ57_04485 [Rhizobiales bacterium]|nr:hypothetical protein [Hyphomicrobiales bacterium]
MSKDSRRPSKSSRSRNDPLAMQEMSSSLKRLRETADVNGYTMLSYLIGMAELEAQSLISNSAQPEESDSD